MNHGEQKGTLIVSSRWLAGATLLAAAMLAAVPVAAEGELYFVDVFNPTFSDGFIRSVYTDGSSLETIVDTGGGLRGLDVDAGAGKIYWTDVDDDAIRRANLDGSDQEDLVTTGLAFPRQVVLYLPDGKLYWGDQTLGEIGRANLDGSDPEILLFTPFSSGLAIDEPAGKVYWTTAITGSDGQILRADLDGTNVEVVVTDEDKPADIALDVVVGKVYWTDYAVDVVRRANLDGSGVEDLYVVGANLNPGGIVLDLAAGKVYWGQAVITNRDKIMRMNLDGSDPEDVITDDGFGIIADFALVPEAGLLGDLNCDDQVNFFDIDAFVLAITDPAGYEEAYPDCDIMLADIDGDGQVSFFDIDGFVELITG